MAPVAGLALLLVLLPSAAGQTPEPADVVAEACATAGAVEPKARELVPLCPREEPAPAAPADEAAAEPAAQPAAPETAQALAAEVLEDARRTPEDPAAAPERLASIVATVVQFAKDLLGLPGNAVRAAGETIADAAADAKDAAAEAAAIAAHKARAVVDAVKELLAPPARAPATALPDATETDKMPRADGLLPRLPRLSV